MLRGCGASSVVSLGPSSLAAAAVSRLSFLGLQCVGGVTCLERCEVRGLSSAAATVQPASAPSTTEATSSIASRSGSDVDSSHLSLNFSIRPSVLSPLFPVWDQARKMSQRRDHLQALLKSHTLLSTSFQAKSDAALARQVRRRVDDIQQAASQIRQLLDNPLHALACSPCPSLAHATAYFASLEANALNTDSAVQDFARVQCGETSPWAHYAHFFAEPYRNAPRLQPLEVIFSKPDPAELARQLRASAASSAASGDRAIKARIASSGPHIDVEGVTHAAGKRKSSSATLDLVPGSGQITVNGLPIASYFRDMGARQHALEPLMIAGCENKYDITVRVRGGGMSGQAQAVRTAVARALCVQQPALAGSLAELTRWDGRVVERKKPAREKARRGYTWVKR